MDIRHCETLNDFRLRVAGAGADVVAYLELDMVRRMMGRVYLMHFWVIIVQRSGRELNLSRYSVRIALGRIYRWIQG